MCARGRVLVTGLRGFTGQYLKAELDAHGYEVFGLGHGGVDLPRYYQVELGDIVSLRQVIEEVRPELVVHLAALAFVGHGNPDDFYQVNLVGTRHLLEAIHDSATVPRKILIASSANIYGNSTEELITEDTPPAPANDYAVSKLAMEHMAKLWGGRLPLVIARPFNYTGVGQAGNFLLPKIVDHFRRRATSIELGNLDVSRDFSDVRTVVHLYRRLLEQRLAVGGTYNVCSGETYQLGDIISICSELTGHAIKVEVNPAFVRSNEVRVLQGDNSRLRSLLGGWQAVALRETLQWMLDAD